MLANAKLPVTFWVEAVNTACYVQNRVLVTKLLNKTPYELFNGRAPAIWFLRPFGCHVMILNNLDHLGKFDAKGDEGTKEDVKQAEKGSPLRFIAFPNWFHEAQMITTNDAAKKRGEILIDLPQKEQEESSKLPSIATVETAVPTVSTHVPTDSENIFTIDPSEPPSTPTVESIVPTVSTPVPTVIKFRGGLR
ncbi:retrovirus-related pol polyprotein from transposon TNT 1-94 [Tanacetum coccineum]